MTNESTRVSSCIINPLPLAETPWQFHDETPDIVRTYFNAVGIVRWLPEEDFKRSLSQRFGSDASDYLGEGWTGMMEAKIREYTGDTSNGDTYWSRHTRSVRQGNLDLALAVRSQYDGCRHEKYFSWFTAANLPQPRRILDVGCDIGLTTCFYAVLYPQATIVGMDCSRKAIECAQELAARLHLTNVEFIEADVLQLPESLEGQRFDLICSTCVAAHYVFPGCADSVEDLLDGADNDGEDYAQALANLLADDKSTLASFDDPCTPHYLASWLWALRNAGIYVSYEHIELLDYFDTKYRGHEYLPVMIGSKQPVELPTAEEIRSLWTGGLDTIPDQDVYIDVEAESVLMAAEPKTLHDAFYESSCTFDHAVTTEVWSTGSHVLVNKSGYFGKKLVRVPTENPEHVAQLLCEILDDEDLDGEYRSTAFDTEAAAK